MNKFGFSCLLGEIQGYDFSMADRFDAVVRHPKALCYKHMVSQFKADKIFVETTDFILILDGIILNKKDLQRHSQNWEETILQLYHERGELFFEVLRGSFAGLLYDKQLDKYIIFSDQIGSKYIYYSQHEHLLCCSSMICHIYHFLQKNHLAYGLSIESAYLLLSYGYMLENHTLCDKIKKLTPGCYMVFQHGCLEEKRYCLLDNEPDYSLKEADAIDLVNQEFRKAIAMQFDKDVEYGYKHWVALSAGLDSRMTTWVAHDMGYVRQVNFTFSQSDYWDEIVPKQIARELRHEWIFKMLDHGWWLQDIEEITKLTGGNVLYYGLAHGNSLFKYIRFDELGMVHSGQLGDVVLGSFFLKNEDKLKFQWGDGAYSTTYLEHVRSLTLSEYKNQEIANFYHRGFNGANNGLLTTMQYTETFSPFMNWELMNQVLKIPLKYRYGHELYKKWILTQYPGAANYVWEKMGATIKSPVFKIKDHYFSMNQLLHKIIEKIFHGEKGYMSVKHMNPIGYYWHTNNELQQYFHEIWEVEEQIPDPGLRGILQQIQAKGSVLEKIQAISLLKAIELFF